MDPKVHQLFTSPKINFRLICYVGIGFNKVLLTGTAMVTIETSGLETVPSEWLLAAAVMGSGLG